jgi:hypothetical protein
MRRSDNTKETYICYWRLVDVAHQSRFPFCSTNRERVEEPAATLEEISGV